MAVEVTVLAVGGTGESYPGDARHAVTGMLHAVTHALDDRFAARWVGYPASYGPVATGGSSFRDSVAAGVANLRAALDDTAGPVVLLGYSQGCTVVRHVLGLRADGEPVGEHVVGAALVSDPQQPVSADDRRRGVAGDGPALPPIPVLWVGHPRDMICNASDDSLVRDVADLTAWMSWEDRSRWRRETWRALRGHRMQNSPKTRVHPRQWVRDVRRLRTAAREVAGYLPRTLRWRKLVVRNPRGGRHVSYATEPFDRRGTTGCGMVAEWLRVQATFGFPPPHPSGQAPMLGAIVPNHAS
ncbi:PE-PPE domain-containing protein [Rhodococcus sp. HNM0569]|uniref:PE-PPE domain-containing protein n=1 Tax=Rhodococcus sp. HNM0569 TaxID=2716340 RepID=UPI003211D4D1